MHVWEVVYKDILTRLMIKTSMQALFTAIYCCITDWAPIYTV
jgi:hypothetical protein